MEGVLSSEGSSLLGAEAKGKNKKDPLKPASKRGPKTKFDPKKLRREKKGGGGMARQEEASLGSPFWKDLGKSKRTRWVIIRKRRKKSNDRTNKIFYNPGGTTKRKIGGSNSARGNQTQEATRLRRGKKDRLKERGDRKW